MEIQKLDENTIKCTISAIEAEKRHITLEKLVEGTYEHFEELVQEIVDNAYDTLNFDIFEDVPEDIEPGLLINAGVDSSGNVCLFLVKDIIQETEPEYVPTYTPIDNYADIQKAEFSEIEAAITAVKTICSIQSSLYKYKSRWILILFNQKRKDFDSICNRLSEFTSIKECDIIELSKLKEHGQLVFEGNAIRRLKQL